MRGERALWGVFDGVSRRAHRKSQSLCEADEAQHGEVPLTQLNLTNVRWCQAKNGAEALNWDRRRCCRY